MSIDKILILDTETGGLDPTKYSCLTAALVAVDLNKKKVIDKLYVQFKHDVYRVHPKALEVNRIDLIKHDKEALPVKEAVGKIVDFIQKNFKGAMPARPGGQNYPFDEGFLKVLFAEAGADFSKFVHYSYLDTLPILRLMATFDIIPESACRLDGARKQFNIQSKKGGQAHHAMTDVEDTISLFSILAEILQGGGTKAKDDNEDDESEVEQTKVIRQEIMPAQTSKKVPAETEENDEDDENDENNEEEEEQPKKRSLGRPKGSKNKIKEDVEPKEDDDEDDEEDKPVELKNDEEDDDKEDQKDEEEDNDDEEDDDDFDDWGDEDDDEEEKK